jgi:DNA topoisomerase-2
MSNKYIKLTQIEHILHRPNMYIGEIINKKSKEFILESNDSYTKIIEKEIDYNPGLYKICDELLVNAYDASITDKTVNLIKVSISKKSFTIFNTGIGIPIEKHSEYKIYTPELIFANLLTSSNFSDTEERITGGLHGLGSKLSAIFSLKFIVQVWYNKLYYKQIYENNLSIIGKPNIEKQTSKIGGVSIEIFPDFKRFDVEEFSDDMIKLISRRVIDLTSLVRPNIKIILNDRELQNGFENYLKLYKSSNEWFIGNCIKNNFWHFAIRFNDNLEINHHISFVNCIFTNNGGTHLDYLLDLLLPKFQKLIDSNITKKFIKENVTICLITSIVNPLFNSQSKETLVLAANKFGFECPISSTFFDQLKNSTLINKLKEINSKMNLKQLGKFDGSKKKKIIISKLEDANFAGTKKSNNCVLILTEGDSAKATAISGISAIKDGRNYYGVFPLRGKLLNVREATVFQINNNQEIIDIKKILGLKSGHTYTKENINEIRYGSILLMMDADEDGSHIKGLIINFINYFYPSLLKIDGFLKVLMTPVVKLFLKDNTINFSNLRAYNNYLLNNKINNIKIKYYKGLGTSTSQEAKEYFTNINENQINIIDKNNDKDILLAFAKDNINERKLWLANYNSANILDIEPPSTITIGEFINQELIHFSNFDNIRSIPSLCDGFKPSQRKVIFGCLKKNLKTEMKVAQLASFVAQVTAYHHGEQSLVLTIINLAQNFVGSNNINLLMPQGQFGTRLSSKDYASGRYIFTFINPILDYIIKKEDTELLDYNIEDNQIIEPKYYLPIIPLILINGSEGIGTGFSTNIPNYNIKDLIIWFQNKILNKKNNILIPYYHNFKGRIIKFDATTYVSEGICKIDNDKIYVTELPIKYWTSNYKEFLDELIETKNCPIKSYLNNSSDVEVNFILKIDIEHIDHLNKLNETIDEYNMNSLYKFLKLYKTIKLSNLTLYNNEFKIETYKTPEDICNEFYKWRLPFYQKRKELIIKNLENEILLLTNQVQWINIVKTNKNIFNIGETDLIKLLKDNKINMIDNTYDYLINMSFKNLSKTNLDKLTNKIIELKKEKKIIENKTDKELWLTDLNLLYKNII